MAVSKRTRFEVLRRDEFTCRYCHHRDNELTVDHVVPVALGGSDDPSNLVAACRDCNAGKTSSAPDQALIAQVDADALRWARAVALAAQWRSVERDNRDDYTRAFDEAWCAWGWGSPPKPIPRDAGWRNSIWRFFELDLPLDDLLDAVEVACSNGRIGIDQTWRYMCGIAWKCLREQQELARKHIKIGRV